MKKKIGNQANMLVVEDLILAYNWGPAKDPAKTPPLTGLEDEEDYAGIHHYIDNDINNFSRTSSRNLQFCKQTNKN